MNTYVKTHAIKYFMVLVMFSIRAAKLGANPEITALPFATPSWLEEKSENHRNNIMNYIHAGDFRTLIQMQKNRLAIEYNFQENIEIDQLVECMCLSIMLQKRTADQEKQNPYKKRTIECKIIDLYDKFHGYVKKNNIAPKVMSMLEKDTINYIKLLTLRDLKTSNFELFKSLFALDNTVSKDVLNLYADQVRRYCDLNYKESAFKEHCELVAKYQKIINEAEKKNS